MYHALFGKTNTLPDHPYKKSWRGQNLHERDFHSAIAAYFWFKIMNRETLSEALRRYHSQYEEENAFVPGFLELLLHPQAFQRNHLPGHITGSAFILDAAGTHVLLTHHAKLNRWLQPGGHADGQEDVLAVALREAKEETGLNEFRFASDGLFDIDIHTIPARDNFPDHFHYDLRFLLVGDRNEELLVTEESHALAWIPLDQLPTITKDNASVLRMASKIKSLF